MSSQTINECQVCGDTNLEQVFSAGWLPPVNTMRKVGERPTEETWFPAILYRCPKCTLVQLGTQVDPNVLFPSGYAYRSGTTKLLRANFRELAYEVVSFLDLESDDDPEYQVVDIGSNDGTLLNELRKLGCKVLGIEPTDARHDAESKAIPTLSGFLDWKSADYVRSYLGGANIVTACNVFAHIPDPNEAVKNILHMLVEDGVFVSESHYLPSLLTGLQYDTVYHEHLRYYSLSSLKHLLEQHGLEINYAKKIPTHGGSIRVYASRRGQYKVHATVQEMINQEGYNDSLAWEVFRSRATEAKTDLWMSLHRWIICDGKVFGVGAPSRSVTLVNYCGLDENVLECICEVPDSPKIGHYLPGTMIPIVDEARLYEEQPEYALLLSWHIAEELTVRLKAKGFRGRVIVPLPKPRIIDEFDLQGS